MAATHMRDLFAADPGRFERFSLQVGELLVEVTGQQQRAVGERLPPDRLGHPHGPVAQLLQLRRRLLRPRHGLQVQGERPQPDASEIHGRRP